MVYSEIRRQARENLRGNWAQAILVAVIAGLLGGTISSAGGSASTSAGSSYTQAFQSIPPEVLQIVTAILTALAVLALVTFIIGWEFLSALTLGIGFLWVVPYKNAAMAVFYREISGPQIHTAE